MTTQQSTSVFKSHYLIGLSLSFLFSSAAFAQIQTYINPAANSATSTQSTSNVQAYSAHIKSKIEAQTKLPASNQMVTAIIDIHLNPAGYVKNKALIRSSGNATWDAALMAAISRASPFPTPVHPIALKGVRLYFRH